MQLRIFKKYPNRMKTDFKFSYTTQASTPFKRFLIQLVEQISGRRHLERLYLDIQNQPAQNPSFWAATMRALALNIQFNQTQLTKAPKTGPLVVVSNHPYGVLDGLTICYLVEKIRPDFKILASAVLMQVPEIAPYILSVDLSNRAEALQHNIATRKAAIAHVKNGGALIIFPAGLISTSPDKLGRKQAIDPPWGTFTAQLIKRSQAAVLPMFFQGQNSRLFQIVSHISRTIRLALIFHEVKARIGSDVQVGVGEVMHHSEFTHYSNPDLMVLLRQKAYALAQ
jgi:putative hemolysin